jgi:hypothetical protein
VQPRQPFIGKYVPGWAKQLGIIERPTWKSVSVGRPTVSQVSVDPHRAQKPRSVFPGVDSNLAISPLVTVYAVRS